MGRRNDRVAGFVTVSAPPSNVCEVGLIGPGYGECIVLHVGEGVWIVVDSCEDDDGTPSAIRYLEDIGVDPTEQVALIVATHWHEDHIGGMGSLLNVCNNAQFCCASALCRDEFLTVAHALTERPSFVKQSGLGEIRRVFEVLRTRRTTPTFAISDRPVFSQGQVEVRSLSPSDSAFQRFLGAVGEMVLESGAVRSESHWRNQMSVVLSVRAAGVTILLGADLEKSGWHEILDGAAGRRERASVFKVAHHGSMGADVPQVWSQMLEADPVAMLTPWRRGGRELPSDNDVLRILRYTSDAYASATRSSAKVKKRGVVGKSLADRGIRLAALRGASGVVRLRRSLDGDGVWSIETIGSACHLRDFAA